MFEAYFEVFYSLLVEYRVVRTLPTWPRVIGHPLSSMDRQTPLKTLPSFVVRTFSVKIVIMNCNDFIQVKMGVWRK